MLHLFVIDPQNDFCDLPALRGAPPGRGPLQPSLPVPGAHADMQRLARWLDAEGDAVDAISVSLDSHQRLDIAHPPFWRRAGGEPVAPFTQIAAADVRSGQFVPARADDRPRALAYLDALEARGRYQLMIWPVHCELGTFGHAVHADVHDALVRWQEQRLRTVRYVHKGESPWTEHYSALLAEVPDPADPRTLLQRELLEQLAAADRLVIAGEASSHCVRATVLDLLGSEGGVDPARVWLLTDCMSPVRGFEAEARAFFDEVRARGAHLVTSANFHPAHRAHHEGTLA